MKARPSTRWSGLDNAAKIFPPTSSKQDTKVFRFACELYEEVDPDMLQRALDQTLELFPSYQYVLKRGLFWYYFESTDRRPVVSEEDLPPCAALYDRNRRQLLFRVSYYHRRINLEVYHALADGTGALHFLRMLVYHYLTIRHAGEFVDHLPPMDYDASLTQKGDDSFKRYYNPEKKSHLGRGEAAYQLKGPRVPEKRIKVIEGVVSVKALLAKAREYHTTMTVLLTAAFMCAVAEEIPIRERKKPVVVTVPVNLRNFFESESVRNFFSVMNVGYDFKNNPSDLASVVQHVEAFFRENLTAEKLEERLNALSSLERNIFARATPLIIKDFALWVANRSSEREITCSLSNIGKVNMPEPLHPYIRLFDVFVSTDKLQICMCSFLDNLSIAFTSSFISADIQKRFFRILTDMGLEAEIVTNLVDEE